MQRLTLVLAAAVALMFGLTSQAFAADAKAPAAPPPISKEAITAGMKEAPPVVQQAGIPCTLTSAALLGGTADAKDSTGKTYKGKVYEVACQEGLGYILSTRGADKPQVFDCVMAKSAVKCNLPANANPEQGLQKTVASAGSDCTVNNARYLGTSPTAGVNIYEVGCAQGVSYIMYSPTLGSTAKISLLSCIKAELAKQECEFTPKAQRVAHLAQVSAAAAEAKVCTANDARWVAGDPNKGTDYYELGCDGGKNGFMVEISGADKFIRSIPCAQADGIAGGCTFTNVNTAQTSENGTYTKLATAAGAACTVDKYRFLYVDGASKSEVVELSCSNRPAGLVGFFPTDAGAKGHTYDCVRATGRGINCKLTPVNLAYPGLTQALTAKGHATCQVSNARVIGTAQNSEFVETACSDGLPGWVIEYDVNSPTVNNVIACTQAKGIGGGCTLPGNGAPAAAAAAGGAVRR